MLLSVPCTVYMLLCAFQFLQTSGNSTNEPSLECPVLTSPAQLLYTHASEIKSISYLVQYSSFPAAFNLSQRILPSHSMPKVGVSTFLCPEIVQAWDCVHISNLNIILSVPPSFTFFHFLNCYINVCFLKAIVFKTKVLANTTVGGKFIMSQMAGCAM